MVLEISLLLAATAALAAFVLIARVRGWEWTGFRDKTLWDWMQLLVIPLALAAVAFGFDSLQRDRDRHREDRRADNDQRIAADIGREEALRAYLQRMSDLLLDRRLATAPGGSTVNSVARTLTLTVLRRLDGRRKGIVVQFLAEAHLIDYDPATSGPLGVSESPKVSLFRADLRKLTFEDPPLFGAGLNLMGADLSEASIGNVQMTANLKRATLRDADLRRVVLGGSLESADLSGADLTGATLTTVTLDKACVTGARLVNVEFREATDFGRMAGYDVDLSGAQLIRADLSRTRLGAVKSDGAALHDAKLPRNWNANDVEVGEDEVARWCRRASPPG